MRWSYEAQKLFPTTMLRLILGIALAMVYFVARTMFSGSMELADSFGKVMKVFQMILSGASSYIHMPIGEILMYLGVLGVAAYAVYQIIRLIASPGKLARLARIAADIVLATMIVVCGGYVLHGYSYACTPAHTQMKLSVAENYTTQDLYDTGVWLLEQANSLAESVPRSTTGCTDFGAFSELTEAVCDGFTTLSATYPFLQSTYAPAKASQQEAILSHMGVSGEYLSITGECVINTAYPASSQPYVVARELAHRVDVAANGEANFVAFMVCRSSKDRRILYSGYMMAFRTCYMVLNRSDSTLAAKLLSGASNKLIFDLQELSAAYSRTQKDLLGICHNTYVNMERRYGQESDSDAEIGTARLLIAQYMQEH